MTVRSPSVIIAPLPVVWWQLTAIEPPLVGAAVPARYIGASVLAASAIDVVAMVATPAVSEQVPTIAVVVEMVRCADATYFSPPGLKS
jgi:hypothetical protein